MWEAATICPRTCKLTFDLESGVRVTCDVGYLCVNFGLPRPLCSRLRLDECDRQTSDIGLLWLVRFHFRFGFGSVLHRKPRFRFLREIWVKQTINCIRNNVIREPRQLRPI